MRLGSLRNALIPQAFNSSALPAVLPAATEHEGSHHHEYAYDDGNNAHGPSTGVLRVFTHADNTKDKTHETAQDRKDKGPNSKGIIRPDRLRHMFHIHFLKILVKYGYDINPSFHVQRNNVLVCQQFVSPHSRRAPSFGGNQALCRSEKKASSPPRTGKSFFRRTESLPYCLWPV